MDFPFRDSTQAGRERQFSKEIYCTVLVYCTVLYIQSSSKSLSPEKLLFTYQDPADLEKPNAE